MQEKVFTTENKNLTIRMVETDQHVTLFWEGKCTLLYPTSFLNPIFEEIQTYNKKIIMNFMKLDYITSSTFAPLIHLLNDIKAGQGSIDLLYDIDSEWQEHNFSALNLFCTDDKRIQVLGIRPTI